MQQNVDNLRRNSFELDDVNTAELTALEQELEQCDVRFEDFEQKDKDTNTQLPATPAVSDQDSSEDDDYITKVTPYVVTKAGRRIKIPNRLDL
ncbi:hypothetical protein HNY73_011694 [Argiope bruennichi]|uniref:Uncharacterized protein n=1 Tax=Argiope bruennichi TaxID=94029 RepID=A0A8T0EYY6_ARGBR|nr:hypothetical protein HNY73_011694 [Argiope bruennichi]